MGKETTTIEIRVDQWQTLRNLQTHPSETMADAVDRLIDRVDDVQEESSDDRVDDVQEESSDDRVDDVQEESSDDRVDDVIAEQREQWLAIDSGPRVDQRVEAVRAAIEFVTDEGVASKSEIIDEIEPEHPVDGQSERTWYRKTVRPVLNEIASYDQSSRGYRID